MKEILKSPLAVLKPEINILATLLDERPKKFIELKFETGLSDPWLAKTLKKLVEAKVLDFDGKRYKIATGNQSLLDIISNPAVYSHFLMGKAIRLAKEISNDPTVVGIILFGTAAGLEANPSSDLDLLIITKSENTKLSYKILDLEIKYNVPIEAIIISLEELKQSLKMEPNLIFGLLARYNILIDKNGQVTELLLKKEREIKEAYVLDRRTMLWLRK